MDSVPLEENNCNRISKKYSGYFRARVKSDDRYRFKLSNPVVEHAYCRKEMNHEYEVYDVYFNAIPIGTTLTIYNPDGTICENVWVQPDGTFDYSRLEMPHTFSCGASAPPSPLTAPAPAGRSLRSSTAPSPSRPHPARSPFAKKWLCRFFDPQSRPGPRVRAARSISGTFFPIQATSCYKINNIFLEFRKKFYKNLKICWTAGAEACMIDSVMERASGPMIKSR